MKNTAQGTLPPGWKEVVSPLGNAIFVNTKAHAAQFDAPEMTVSDRPFAECTFINASGLDSFQHMDPNFYVSLDAAFESAAFRNLAEIRRLAQENVRALAESGELDKLGMSRDEAEVLFSYSFETKGGKETPCYIMNRTLADRDSNALINHRGYILHLLKALRKLEPIPTSTPTGGRTVLYRGIDGRRVRFDEKHYKVGNRLSWPAFTSTTLCEDVVYSQFLVRVAQPVIFEIHGDFVGYNIRQFSCFVDEDEVLLEPETTFRVESIQQDTRMPQAKRVVVVVQKTPLMIKEAVENFAHSEWNYCHNNGGFNQAIQQQQASND